MTLHTDLGDIKIELFCERAPKSCEVMLCLSIFTLVECTFKVRANNMAIVYVLLQNFLALCASGFYNGCIFHRNIKGFMVQTGDPTGNFKTCLPGLESGGKI